MNDNKELQRQSDGVDALGHSGHTPAHDPDLVFGPVFFPPREVNKRFSIAGRASRQLEVESNGTFRRVAGEPSEGWFWSEQQSNFFISNLFWPREPGLLAFKRPVAGHTFLPRSQNCPLWPSRRTGRCLGRYAVLYAYI